MSGIIAGGGLPEGPWWKRLLQMLRNVIFPGRGGKM
ncbi:MAG: hypothetical protein QOJ13_1360 [Gaiellales bacterium]|jgi:hypothetical protein|nr:hypothetical protein [Gaiellales bacterium]MDX6592164.1 hypothetical protein [Gaiellales bacterium]